MHRRTNVRIPIQDKWLIPALLALGAVLKSGWLGVNELSGDEPFTVYWSQRPLAEFFAMLRSENNPPLHFLLVKCWSHWVPLDAAWLRVPSAIFSALTVWPLFLIARALGDRRTAVVACLLFTLNNHQFTYAHEVRGYPLLLLLCVTSFWLAIRQARTPSRSGVLLLASVFIAQVYTHFFGWLAIGLLGLCVFTLHPLRASRRTFLISTACALLAFAPYGLIFMHRAGESIAQGTWVKPHGIEEVWHMVRRWSNQPMVTLLMLVPMIATMVRHGLQPIVRLALLWLLVPLLGLWLVQWWVPAYVDRYLLFASPGFYLLAAHGLVPALSGVRRWWLVPSAGVVAMAATFTPWKDNGHHPSHVAAQVRAWQRSGTDPPVLVYPFHYKPTFQWAMDPARFAAPDPVDPWSPIWNPDAPPITDSSVRDVIVVCAVADDEPGWAEAKAGLLSSFSISEVRELDRGVRVIRFQR